MEIPVQSQEQLHYFEAQSFGFPSVPGILRIYGFVMTEN
jgi:hypothetical protein